MEFSIEIRLAVYIHSTDYSDSTNDSLQRLKYVVLTQSVVQCELKCAVEYLEMLSIKICEQKYSVISHICFSCIYFH